MRTKGTAKELEVKRRIAINLLQQGHSRAEVAREVGASWTSVDRWREAFEKGGWEAIAAKQHPGRPRLLTSAQEKQVLKILLRGPRKSNFDSDMWTAKRVAAVIERRFDVKYHPHHVMKLLAQWKWTRQKPQRRPREQDQAAVEHWRTHEWKRIKKGNRAAS